VYVAGDDGGVHTRRRRGRAVNGSESSQQFLVAEQVREDVDGEDADEERR
jgi:hypothetical protein